MNSGQRYIPTVGVPLKSLFAPTVLLFAYGALSFVDASSLPASKLVLATLAYLAVVWSRNIRHLIRNVFDQAFNDRLFVGSAIALFAFGWMVLIFWSESQLLMQRLFTVGPILLGLMWLGGRNTKEVVGSRAIWNWWRLDSPRHSSFAATVFGVSLLIRGSLNEFVIAIDFDFVWVLSCAALPIATRWCCDTVTVRGLVKRGAIYRNKASC